MKTLTGRDLIKALERLGESEKWLSRETGYTLTSVYGWERKKRLSKKTRLLVEFVIDKRLKERQAKSVSVE